MSNHLLASTNAIIALALTTDQPNRILPPTRIDHFLIRPYNNEAVLRKVNLVKQPLIR